MTSQWMIIDRTMFMAVSLKKCSDHNLIDVIAQYRLDYRYNNLDKLTFNFPIATVMP